MKQILCFGDSNTWGLIPGTKERYSWGVRWTSILQEKLMNYGVRVIEDGLCGRTTVFDDMFRPYRNGSKGLPLSLEVNSGFDIVILMLGTNDCKSYYKANANVIGRGIETLLKQIKAANHETKIILASPIEMGEDIWKEDYDPEFERASITTAKELQKVYKEIAKKWKIEYVAASDYAKPSEVDREHMTKEGHKNLANAFYEKLIPILN